MLIRQLVAKNNIETGCRNDFAEFLPQLAVRRLRLLCRNSRETLSTVIVGVYVCVCVCEFVCMCT